jgi:hypothetical protein
MVLHHKSRDPADLMCAKTAIGYQQFPEACKSQYS